MFDFVTQPWEETNCIVEGVATIRCIWPVFHNLINVAIVLSAIAALYFIIISGIRYITSRGDPEALESARRTATFAIIGLVFVLMSFFFFNFILDTLGVDPKTLVVPAPEVENP